jgi:hypothetical protein
MPPVSEWKLLLVGDDSAVEMIPVVEALAVCPAGVEVRRVRTIFAAIELAASADPWFPDLIVILQCWPDEFASDAVHGLLAAFPLARLVCSYGPWCESDGRNRSIWPSGCRVSATMAARRLAREIDSLMHGHGAGLPPLTAARDELFGFDYAATAAASNPITDLPVAIVSPDGPLRRMLVDAVTKAGGRLVCDSELGRSHIVVWDADPWATIQRRRLTDQRLRSERIGIVALVGMPDSDLQAALHDAGADRVVSKMAPIPQLAATLRELAESRPIEEV